jgi:hypothetical protein
MTTELMTRPINYDIEQTLNYPRGVTTAFLKKSKTDLQTPANSASLLREKIGLTDSKASSPRRIPERRLHGNRVAMAIDTALFTKGQYQGNGTIRNLALRGLFVETAVELDENTVLQLRFCLPNEQGSDESYRLWGTVAHSSEKGIGLHVDILHPETDAGLQAIRNHANG